MQMIQQLVLKIQTSITNLPQDIKFNIDVYGQI